MSGAMYTWEQIWLEWYEEAANYFKIHGDLCIPAKYETRGGKKLGKWLERQRAAYKGKGSYRIDSERIRKLEAIGMIWELEKRLKWEEWIVLLTRYRKENGDINVPVIIIRSIIRCRFRWRI